VLASAEQVVVRVRDDGVGIEADFLPYVFDRFRQGERTASRAYGGLGLGLTIAKQLVEAHGGSIAVESPGRGRGATFTVLLPLASPRLDPTRPEVDAAAHAEPGPAVDDDIHLLIVDDRPDARAHGTSHG
jgi:K+-sensing histidine kinase KdpD